MKGLIIIILRFMIQLHAPFPSSYMVTTFSYTLISLTHSSVLPHLKPASASIEESVI